MGKILCCRITASKAQPKTRAIWGWDWYGESGVVRNDNENGRSYGRVRGGSGGGVISFKCRQPGHLARECPSSGGVVIIPMVEVLTDMVAAMVIAALLVLAMAFMCHMLCEVPPFLSIWLVEVSPSNLNDQNGKSMNILLQR